MTITVITTTTIENLAEARQLRKLARQLLSEAIRSYLSEKINGLFQQLIVLQAWTIHYLRLRTCCKISTMVGLWCYGMENFVSATPINTCSIVCLNKRNSLQHIP